MNASDSAPSIYDHMQAAVDIVSTSPHPTNKIAATIAGMDANGNPFALSRTNHWPTIIAEKIGTTTDIGNSSGTIHAETDCILSAPITKNASIFVTDPPCPNCMKNMAEAGITKIYIDHKGFDKDWARRRGDHFETMSMRVAAKAGMDVFVIYRPKQHQEQKFEIISRHLPGYKPAIEHPAIINAALASQFKKYIHEAHDQMRDEPFALALANDNLGRTFSILTDRHPTIGYTYETVESKDDKYSFIMQPINRLLMIAAREGLTIIPEYIYSSRTPTARELINIIGANITTIQIDDATIARDKDALKALQQVQEAQILSVKKEGE